MLNIAVIVILSIDNIEIEVKVQTQDNQDLEPGVGKTSVLPSLKVLIFPKKVWILNDPPMYLRIFEPYQRPKKQNKNKKKTDMLR